MNAPDGLGRVKTANAGLAFQPGTGLAHPVNAKSGFSCTTLDVNDLAGLQHDIESGQTGRNFSYVQRMGKLAFSAGADDGDWKHHLSAKLTPVCHADSCSLRQVSARNLCLRRLSFSRVT